MSEVKGVKGVKGQHDCLRVRKAGLPPLFAFSSNRSGKDQWERGQAHLPDLEVVEQSVDFLGSASKPTEKGGHTGPPSRFVEFAGR